MKRGSSQLKQNKTIFPKTVMDQKVVEENQENYLYLSAINYINTVKTGFSFIFYYFLSFQTFFKKGPFAEHSPILHSLVQLPHWEKINEGMIKMYKGEVLGKYPIIQHFHFGSIIHF